MGMVGKALRRILSIFFWQRTSSSNLMSCSVAELIFFSERKLSRINFPEACAAVTAVERARFSCAGLRTGVEFIWGDITLAAHQGPFARGRTWLANRQGACGVPPALRVELFG